MPAPTKSHKKMKIAILLFIISTVALTLSYESILEQLGNFLVFQQDPRKSDVIVVLNGRDAERSLAAADLYNQGYSALIVVPRGTMPSAYKLLLSRVDPNFDTRIFSQRAIMALGVPDQAFKLIGDGVTSTFDEARITRNFLDQYHYKSVMIVTSKWHSKRTYLTFRHVFPENGNFILSIHASKYDNFDPNSWWKRESTFELVIGEYVRIFFYLIRSRLSLLN